MTKVEPRVARSVSPIMATLAAIVAMLGSLAACGDSEAPDGTASPSQTPSRLATPVSTPSAPPDLSGFQYPIEGACLPTIDNLMPNAPRPYRAGTHEGVDFYSGFSCVDIPLDTAVSSVADGEVIRADTDFVEMTPEELDRLINRSLAQGFTDEPALDRFRGRQVWVDHGDGTVTRYAHLNGIDPAIEEGSPVTAGQALGLVGNSGTPEAVTAPGMEIHLHFEIRVGTSFLGAGLPPDEVRGIYERVFSAP